MGQVGSHRAEPSIGSSMIKKTNPNHTAGFFTAGLRRLSPFLLVVLVAGLILAIATVSRYLAGRGAASVDARVVIERGDQELTQIRNPNNAPARLPDGEVYRTADRLRDAAALAYAAALYAVDRQLQHRTPQTADAGHRPYPRPRHMGGT